MTMIGSEPKSTHHITRMQQIVLQWDYYKLTAPGKGSKPRELRKVPERFESVQDYLSVFEPLLLEECCAQLTRGESQEDFACVPHPAVVFHSEKTLDFHFVQLGVEAGRNRSYAENDLVVLSQAKPRTKEARNKAYALAVVEKQEGQSSLRIRFFLPDAPMCDDADGARLHHSSAASHARTMRTKLQETNSAWWLTRLCNMSTIMREWLGLHSLSSFPFADIIANPRVRADPDISRRACPSALMSHLKQTHNPTQVAAICTALGHNPINLIQGPPGTGKTRTILGLLSVLLQSPAVATTGGAATSSSAPASFRPPMSAEDKKRHWRKASPWLRGACTRELPPTHEMHQLATGVVWPQPAAPIELNVVKDRKLHVLVCAPSNSALDEIVYRITHSGLVDAKGETYIPSIVRVGVNPHHSIQAVSMEWLLRQKVESKDSATGAGRSRKNDRDRVRISILDESSIVCSTLAFSGSSMFSRMTRGFDVVVIDEAAQAVEPSTMVPLGHGCRQLFLVGDPLQLPATVISDRAKEHGYDDSLFKRLQSTGYPVNVLNVQYRMHPEIRMFPSQEFYREELIDGPNVVEDTVRPWHKHPCYGPFAWLDVRGKETTPEGSGSKCNHDEANAALVILKALMTKHEELREPGLLAVISPYKEQVRLISKLLNLELGEKIAQGIDVNTIDGFQGREKLVCIFSGVRSDEKAGIGFVRDQRRMNVGLTRGRSSMLVLGNAKVLRKSAPWRRLVRKSKERRCLFKFASPFEQALERLTSEDYNKEEETYSEEGEDEEWMDSDEESDEEFGAAEEAEGAWVPQAEPGLSDDEDDASDSGGAGAAAALQGDGDELVSEKRGVVGLEDEDGGGGVEDGDVSVGSKRTAEDTVPAKSAKKIKQ